MSKYSPLWQFVAASAEQKLVLSYDEIQAVLGFPIDHSFLSFKKELLEYGWQVEKISIKGQTVTFVRSE